MSSYPGLARLALLLFGAAVAGAASAAPAENGGLEFRAVVQEGDVWLVNLHQSSLNVSQWMRVGAESGGLLIKSYDERTEQVTVVRQGREVVLPLQRYRVSVSGPTAPLKLLGPAELVSPAQAPGMPEYLRNLPPDARKLLEDVRRRRAIRWPAPATNPSPQ